MLEHAVGSVGTVHGIDANDCPNDESIVVQACRRAGVQAGVQACRRAAVDGYPRPPAKPCTLWGMVGVFVGMGGNNGGVCGYVERRYEAGAGHAAVHERRAVPGVCVYGCLDV